MNKKDSTETCQIQNLHNAKSIGLLMEISKTAEILNNINDKFYKKFKLTRVQFKALLFLYSCTSEGITLSSISEKMDITRPTTTSLIDRMVASGLAERVDNEDDRRSIRVIITDKGKEIMKEVLPDNEVFKSTILDFLTETEIETAYKLTMKIKQGLIKKYLKD
ncbi:MarR family transcriptional regulator, 2-MHQ and catechol-resistance regulon repressor [Desulfonispora thiosulfatigenes DSM 11270]|uniref:MarR family transcriptional regulator, 2-MHQ and catechol-resistance regulon repressor n=1 Tax=Desulfonispora thiosulfatigenes DSM 11270 TaxID=656914 RepID=A0A1W1UEY9_DESTI|nr:MarR family transcriptional regulator [Desulfonispora thiosulfatigenes]SMB79609.1 MarR family transcriptional regulator, 2-MHQ and catechol-resistance regulon repressor [Desulfonispora thiosulfatigenes DSM 11270]